MIINALCRGHETLYRRGFFPSAPQQSAPLLKSPAPRSAPPGKAKAMPTPAAPRETWPMAYGFSAKKTASLLDTAKRFTLAVTQHRRGGKEALAAASREEKKKLLKFAFSVLAASSPIEGLRAAFVTAGFLGKAAAEEEYEAEMVLSGTQLALGNAHPIVIMRTMSAFLGFSVFDNTGKWLQEHCAEAGEKDEELIIPGDLSLLVQQNDLASGLIVRAMGLAGPQLVAAALAGCPRETIDYLKSLAYTPLGACLLEADIRSARRRLSSEELSDAQSAFAELLGSLWQEPAAAMEREETGWSTEIDKNLAADISNLILELDKKLLRTVVSDISPRLAAALIQGMDPAAHDRLFSNIAASRGRRILDALDKAAPLSSDELTRAAQIFAQRILSVIAPRTKTLGKPLPLPVKLRQLLSAILSRE